MSYEGIGAWLSGGTRYGSDWRNTDPPGASRRNTDPPGATRRNTDPPGATRRNTDPPGATRRNTDPPGSPQGRWRNTDPPGRAAQDEGEDQGAIDWVGVDPPWTYADADALLGQALNRTRERLLRPADRKVLTVGANGKPRGLWQWDQPFRVQAVVVELLNRCVLEGERLWLVEPPGGKSPAKVSAQLVLDLGFDSAKVNWAEQIDGVLRAAVEREDRFPEIHAQRGDLWPFFEAITGIDLAVAPCLADLLVIADSWAGHLLMGMKNHLAAPRPVHRSPLVVPMIATPGHGSVPSGHATIAAMMSELLVQLAYEGKAKHPRADMLDRLARRIAFNRVVAGVHFPIDGLYGYCLGTQLAWLLQALAAAGPVPPQMDSATLAGVHGKAAGNAVTDRLHEVGVRLPAPSARASAAMPACAQLREVWECAGKEIRRLSIS